MERFYKNIDGDYITTIGTGIGDVEITQEEYDNILSIVRNRPSAESGYGYRLRTDLAWARVEVPPQETDPEISDREAIDIITGVIE